MANNNTCYFVYYDKIIKLMPEVINCLAQESGICVYYPMFRMHIFKAIICFSLGFYRIEEFRNRTTVNDVIVNKLHL